MTAKYTVDEVATPALVLDVDKLDRNLSWMAERTRELGVQLRPHIKTHKCVEIARKQLDLGARGITVATLYEARVFADHGFDNITWAFPIIPNRVVEAQRLAERIQLNVVVDSIESVDLLRRAAHPFATWLKVDCGYHRAGLDPEHDRSVGIARAIADDPYLIFGGILSHSGNAYDAGAPKEAATIAERERSVMVAFAAKLRESGIEVPEISVGSTPGMRAVQSLKGITECRPGNYALFDAMQVALGSCTVEECAVSVLTTVVSSNDRSGHCIVDAGALTMSKDPGPQTPNGTGYGRIFDDYSHATLSPDTQLVGLSQEHGKVNRPLPVGTRLRVLPNHSCLTMAHFDELHVASGDVVQDLWRIWRGR